MFTRKAIAYFSMSITLLVLALLIDDFQLVVLVLGLATLFFLSNVWGLPEEVDIKLSREINPDETFGNEDVRVESQVKNMTNTRLGNLEVIEAIEDAIVPETGITSGPASIGPSSTSKFVFEFGSPPRGNYKIGPLTVRVRDPFGFYLTERKYPPEMLSVMPRPEPLRRTQLRPRHVGPWPGTIASRNLGSGTEFYSMREYVPGDDPKRINWKASARHNSLVVNETEAERVTDVMLVLDTDVTFFRPSERELFERAVQAAASIANHLLKQGNRVGLVLQGGERGSVPAGFGKRHERRILYLLAAAKPGRPGVSTSYVMTLLARRMLPSRAQIVVVSPLLDPEIKDGIRQLSEAGYSLLVLSPSPSTPPSFQSQTERIAFRLIMLERSITLLALERSATVIEWQKETPLIAAMSRVRRARRNTAA